MSHTNLVVRRCIFFAHTSTFRSSRRLPSASFSSAKGHTLPSLNTAYTKFQKKKNGLKDWKTEMFAFLLINFPGWFFPQTWHSYPGKRGFEQVYIQLQLSFNYLFFICELFFSQVSWRVSENSKQRFHSIYTLSQQHVLPGNSFSKVDLNY